MMKIIPLISFLANLAVNLWLSVVVWRREVWKPLRWFSLYVAAGLLSTGVGLTLWFVDRRLYVTVFWWMEAAKIALIVAAVRESFVRTFVGFTSLRWFPWVVRGVIAGVVAYSIWKAIYAPPVQSNRLISFIIAGEFTFRWGFVGIGLLSLALLRILELPHDTRETAVIDGYTIASAAFLVYVISRSFFGTRFVGITQFVPDIGYVLAVILWIKYMSRPEREFGFKELGMTPEALAAELRRYREVATRLLGNSKGT